MTKSESYKDTQVECHTNTAILLLLAESSLNSLHPAILTHLYVLHKYWFGIRLHNKKNIY